MTILVAALQLNATGTVDQQSLSRGQERLTL